MNLPPGAGSRCVSACPRCGRTGWRVPRACPGLGQGGYPGPGAGPQPTGSNRFLCCIGIGSGALRICL